jgi:hypothetical protein
MGVRIERRGEETVFVDSCGKPVAVLSEEGLKIQSKHSSSKCENILSWQQIEEAKKKSNQETSDLQNLLVPQDGRPLI